MSEKLHYATHFFVATRNVCPLSIPESCAHNMGLRNASRKTGEKNEQATVSNKPQAAQAIDEDEEDALFKAAEFGDSNPVALQRFV